MYIYIYVYIYSYVRPTWTVDSNHYLQQYCHTSPQWCGHHDGSNLLWNESAANQLPVPDSSGFQSFNSTPRLLLLKALKSHFPVKLPCLTFPESVFSMLKYQLTLLSLRMVLPVHWTPIVTGQAMFKLNTLKLHIDQSKDVNISTIHVSSFLYIYNYIVPNLKSKCLDPPSTYENG